MSYLSDVKGFVSTNNTDLSLNETSYNYDSGTIQSSTGSITVIANTASGTDDIYNGLVIEITHGTGEGNTRLINDYNGTTKTVTLSEEWNIQPDSTSKYVIHRNSGSFALNGLFKITLSSSASANDDFYRDTFLKVLHGEGKGKIMKILSYDGTSKVASLDNRWNEGPTTDSLYAIYGEGGVCPDQSGLSANEVKLAADATSTDYLSGLMIEVFDHNNGNEVQVRRISSYNTTTKVVTVSENFSVTPAQNNQYVMYGGFGGKFDEVTQYTVASNVTVLDTTVCERAIIDQVLSMSNAGKLNNSKYGEVVHGLSKEHSVPITTRYYRIRLINMGTSMGGQNLDVGTQTIYHNTKGTSLATMVEEQVDVTNDVQLNKSVIMAKNKANQFVNIEAGVEKSLKVDLAEPRSVFGEILTTDLSAFIKLNFINGINNTVVKSLTPNASTLTALNNQLNVSTGSITGTLVCAKSKAVAKYQLGQGIDVRFTSIFDTPVSGTSQIIGLGDESNGLFFGYDGTDFGVLKRTSGKPEIRTLTITTAPTSTADITVTLNSGTLAVAVESTDNITTVAKKIADSDFSSVGGGFFAYYRINSVSFYSNVAESRGGTYSISGAGAVGSFVQDLTGSAVTDDWTYQSDWNVDSANGLSNLPNLNHTKGNIYRIEYQWLGYGMVKYQIANPSDGSFIPVHRLHYSNENTVPSTLNPSLPFGVHIDNGATTNDISMKTASVAVFTQGKKEIFNLRFSKDADAVITNAEAPILVLRQKLVLNSNPSKVVIYIDGVNLSSEDTARAKMNIYKGVEITTGTDAVTFSSVSGDSVIESANFGVGAATDLRIDNTAGDRLLTSVISTYSSYSKHFGENTTITLYPDEILVISGEKLSGGTSSVSVSVSWLEDY